MKIIPILYILLVGFGLKLFHFKPEPTKDLPKNKTIQSEKIHWLSFEEAVNLNTLKPKKIYIDVYTNWCVWCKKMDQVDFENPKIIEEMNRDYYPVKLNAETRDSIRFDQHVFKYLTQYRANEFALALLHGQMSYPTTVILDQDKKILSRIPGYMEANQLEEILNYFGQNNHLKYTWNQYQKKLGHDTLEVKK